MREDANTGASVWSEADGLHLDVRGLPPPQPLVQIMQIVLGGTAPSLVVHLDRDPVLLYPELAQAGWGAEALAGEPGEVRLRLVPLA